MKEQLAPGCCAMIKIKDMELCENVKVSVPRCRAQGPIWLMLNKV